jgi:hypothetical protein
MKTRAYRIVGASPLIQHNAQLADPVNEWTRALKTVTKKRLKTDDDLIEMSRLEWMGGLYYEKEIGPYVPEGCIERMLRDAAAKSRRGKDVVSGLIVTAPSRLEYVGPRDPKTMWASGDFLLRASVGVNGKRVIRSRPVFRNWAIQFAVDFDENVLDGRDIDGFVEVAGRLIGLMDWRPKHGRFNITEIDGKAP